MTRPHWDRCIAHFDDAVGSFAADYFGDSRRHCLVVAAAGFDPRSLRIPTLLSEALGGRLSGLFVREERGTPDVGLIAAATENAQALSEMVSGCQIESVDIFGVDNAPVAGARIASVISNYTIPSEVTDVVLDMTALSIGIGFPAAKLLLHYCEENDLAFHIMIASNPELDDEIASEPGDRPIAVRGFAGADQSASPLEIAKIWIPQLARGRSAALTEIGRSVGETYKICPVVPFPARDPRRADALVAEYQTQLVDEWQVDPRDLVYVSERNPLDCYRTLSTLKARYDQTVADIFEPAIILSPIGSRVMAAGALMAALEHDLPVQYIETVRYAFDPTQPAAEPSQDMIVHLLLSGPAYSQFQTPASQVSQTPYSGASE
jgi:hypothetical protein